MDHAFEGHEKLVLDAVGDDLTLGGHARAQAPVGSVDKNLNIKGLDFRVALTAGEGGHTQHLAVELLAGEGVDGEDRLLVGVHLADKNLVDLGLDHHGREIGDLNQGLAAEGTVADLDLGAAVGAPDLLQHHHTVDGGAQGEIIQLLGFLLITEPGLAQLEVAFGQVRLVDDLLGFDLALGLFQREGGLFEAEFLLTLFGGGLVFHLFVAEFGLLKRVLFGLIGGIELGHGRPVRGLQAGQIGEGRFVFIATVLEILTGFGGVELDEEIARPDQGAVLGQGDNAEAAPDFGGDAHGYRFDCIELTALVDVDDKVAEARGSGSHIGDRAQGLFVDHEDKEQGRQHKHGNAPFAQAHQQMSVEPAPGFFYLFKVFLHLFAFCG
ncbi:MAG: hypothetical protein BWY77_01333 [bacterium ADurb.Bin431]|nr:MAG: hypothetical protein BWY77_01333 [bacterium ADurb.Bin431]